MFYDIISLVLTFLRTPTCSSIPPSMIYWNTIYLSYLDEGL